MRYSRHLHRARGCLIPGKRSRRFFRDDLIAHLSTCMSARPSRDHRRADGGATRTWPPARRPGGRRRDAARVEMDLLRRLQSSDSNRQSALPVNRPPARETHSARVRIVTKHSLRRERTPGTPARSLPRARTRCRSRASYCLALREDLLRRQSQLLGRKLQQTMAWKLQ